MKTASEKPTAARLEAYRAKAVEIRGELRRLGAPEQPVDPAQVKVMLAELSREPFSRKGWIFELKYDGYRLLAAKGSADAPRRRGRRRPRSGDARFFLRSGTDQTVSFPDLARALSALPFESLVIDGEVVVLDEDAKPSFERLARRGRISRPLDAEQAAVLLPATYYAFDLLGFGDFDLRPLPLIERKKILKRVLPRAGPLRFADHVEERGEELYAGVRDLGLEGVMGKKADARYAAGRSPYWLKVRADRTGDYVVIGFTPPKGGRTGFGALHLAEFDGPRLVYAGRVGSGFSDAKLKEMRARLDADSRPDPAVAGALAEAKTPDDVWVEPKMVIEVRYTEATESGQLRFPVFLRERTDKRVEDCLRQLPTAPAETAAEPLTPVPRPRVALSNLAKVYWPEEGYTKGDLIDFYRAVSPWLLPYLGDRPIVLDRYPDGIGGKSFYQKHAPDHAPDWIRTETIWSEGDGSETEYFLADDVETLLYLANLGAIPLHVWSSRFQTLQTPDWSILDLDAKEAPFAYVVEVARAIHRLCESIELPCFAKTSGATGLHVLIPLGGKCTYGQSRQLAEVVARLITTELADVCTIARTVAKRKGRVYVDYLQNSYGKVLVAPFAVRPRPGATVSTPLAWDEVTGDLDPGAFTIKTVVPRLERLGEDPLSPVLELEPNLTAILGRLAEKL